MIVTRMLIVTLAALTGCGRLAFEPVGFDGRTDGNAPDALCPAIDDHFDSLGTWSVYSAGGAPTPTVTGGALVLDVPTAVSTCSVGMLATDLSDAVLTVTVRDYTFVYGSQVYLEAGTAGRYFAVTAIVDIAPQQLILGRIQTGATLDDVPVSASTNGAMRMRLAISPVSGASQVVWSYSPSETAPFVEVRRTTVADSFSSIDFGMTYQNWQTAAADPPPIRIDDFQLAHPCM
jgi:hypothetical protein